VQVKYSGQGRGRTADLPIFRTTVMRSYPSGNVLDLHRKIHPVIGERQRTNSNETEIETAREPAPTAPTPADHCRCKLTQPTPGCPPPAASITPITIGMLPEPEAPATEKFTSSRCDACRGCLSPMALFCPGLSMLPDVRRPGDDSGGDLGRRSLGSCELVSRGAGPPCLQGQRCRSAVRRSPLL
jgi:hypothetical protein